VVVAIKALACELPATTGVPLARWHCPDLARAAVQQGIVASVSGTTIWRWLSADAIKPWRVRSWIFPRDPAFAATAGRVLDLHAGTWDGQPLGEDDGSSHRGQTAARRLQGQRPTLRLVHLPMHASRLNQVEIYFSVIQRKIRTPNDFASLAEVQAGLLAFQDH
jgi:hypothetical protein